MTVNTLPMSLLLKDLIPNKIPHHQDLSVLKEAIEN